MEHVHSNGADRESARGHAEHIAALTSCAEECRRCAAADQREGMDDCAAVCESCAEVCEATANALKRGGLTSEAVDALLAACAVVCRACAEECRRHDADHCRACAEECERCAAVCEAA